jgi:hypothetical protein
MDVVRLNDGPIRVYRAGEPTILLTGHHLILASSKLANELKRLAVAGASFVDVQAQGANGATWPYVEVLPSAEITLASISQVDSSGLKLWHFDRSNLFVSPAIVQELLTHAWSSELQFSPGFSRFAGAA